jgi:methylated-DNA-[protein]-cysteine S-methyltransferase
MQDKFSFCLERVPTPVGCMLLITDSDNIVRAIDWEGYEERMHRLLRLHYGAGNVTLDDTLRPSSIRRTLERYLDGDLVAIDDLPVMTGGTPFQREVWQALRQIPAGQTTTYGDLATQIGRSKAVRAVGLANGANPVGVVVPCHRVIGADASLTGYGGGLERKRWLLEHEGARPPLEAAAPKVKKARDKIWFARQNTMIRSLDALPTMRKTG